MACSCPQSTNINIFVIPHTIPQRRNLNKASAQFHLFNNLQLMFDLSVATASNIEVLFPHWRYWGSDPPPSLKPSLKEAKRRAACEKPCYEGSGTSLFGVHMICTFCSPHIPLHCKRTQRHWQVPSSPPLPTNKLRLWLANPTSNPIPSVLQPWRSLPSWSKWWHPHNCCHQPHE